MLSFGSIMHGTIKRFLAELRKGKKLPFEDVQRLFEMEWRSAGFEDEYQEAEYKRDGIEQLRAFHAAMIEAPPEVREQEKSFELPLENNVIITGRMDQVNSLGRNDVEIVDYKTGKPKKDADAKKALQLSLYALAANGLLIRQLFANRIGGFFGLDVLVSAVVLLRFIRVEGKRLAMSLLWLPIIGVFTIGVSFGLPLFLYLRERALEGLPGAVEAARVAKA